MADQKITELPIKGTSAINFADYLLGIDAADGYQMLISDLAKKIIESYAGSNLGGSAQALKTALDAVSGSLATIESSASASRAYAVGEYLVLGGRLYIVTAAILQGGTITPNTNVVEAGVGDKLTGIESKIGTTTLPTTAQTLTGAIAEHETDISTLNGKVTVENGTLSKLSTITLYNATVLQRIGNLVVFNIEGLTANQIQTGSSGAGFITFPSGYRPSKTKDFIGRIGTGLVGEYYLQTDGRLQTLTTIQENAAFRLSGSFIID